MTRDEVLSRWLVIPKHLLPTTLDGPGALNIMDHDLEEMSNLISLKEVPHVDQSDERSSKDLP